MGIYKEKAVYLYGASSKEYRNLMPNYAVQFKAIEMLKKLEIKEYDLLGIPPIANKNHPLYGLLVLKQDLEAILFIELVVMILLTKILFIRFMQILKNLDTSITK